LQQRALYPQERVRDDWGRDDDDSDSDEPLIFEGEPISLWVDMDTPADKSQPEAHRAIWLHSFVD